jgi:hypothetical protein
MAQQLIGPDRVVGILMANASHLTDRHLESAGVRLGSNYVVGDAMGGLLCEEFDRLWTQEWRTETPAADYDKAEGEFMSVATTFFR